MPVLKRSDPSLPLAPPSLARAPGLVPASTPADGGESRLALEAALDQINSNQWGADAGAAYTRDAGTTSVREFSLFEHGAGI